MAKCPQIAYGRQLYLVESLHQGLANFFIDVPESNYFRLCGPRGHKIKDMYKIIKHMHIFIYCPNIL